MKLDTDYKHLTLWNGQSIFELSQVPKNEGVLFLSNLHSIGLELPRFVGKELDFKNPERFLQFELVREFNDYIKSKFPKEEEEESVLMPAGTDTVTAGTKKKQVDNILTLFTEGQPPADEIEKVDKAIEYSFFPLSKSVINFY